MGLLRSATEGLARKTTRRGFFGKGADVAFGALVGAAAGTLTRGGGSAIAGGGTVCAFPGPPCTCAGCLDNGTCAKPCIIMTVYYASGCWVTGSITCCDCDCNGFEGRQVCGCGSDYHTNPTNCP